MLQDRCAVLQVAQLPDTTTKQVTLPRIGDVAINVAKVYPLVAVKVFKRLLLRRSKLNLSDRN